MRQHPEGRMFGTLIASLAIATLALSAEVAPAESTTRINRTAPTVTGPDPYPRFSSVATDAEISRARVFAEPLIPLGKTSPSENQVLARQLLDYLKSGGGEKLAPVEEFLAAYPTSPWRASILGNVGSVYRRTGYISRALEAWMEAWRLSKGEDDPLGHAVADRALSEYAGLLGRLGRADTLEALLAETEGRPIGGSAAERLSQARDALAYMRAQPESAFLCGPVALDRVLSFRRDGYVGEKAVREFPSTTDGTSLPQLVKLAADVGESLVMAKRSLGSVVTVPAIVHWKSGHFAALVREADDRYLVEDATFGDHFWISRKALEDEATGYFIVPAGRLPVGWRTVAEAEGSGVWGRGVTTENNPENFKPCDPTILCPTCTCVAPPPSPMTGMARYNAHLMLVSLNISDQPVGYSPPFGPAVRFQAIYNQREVYQPQTFTYSNLGPKWTFDWLSYVEDDPSTSPGQDLYLYVRGGGQETYSYNSATQSWGPHRESRATIRVVSVSPIRYERQLADGTVEVFAQPDGVATFPRKVFMTAFRDAQGNEVKLTYDSSLRLTAVTDAAGQVTTLSYDDPNDNLKITKVTDPFSRYATLQYSSGRLQTITDVIAIQSSFTYRPPAPPAAGDFIEVLTTPYGNTTFAAGETNAIPGNPRSRWLAVTDPGGGRERVEYYSHQGDPHNQPDVDPDPPIVPYPDYFENNYLSFRNTFYWDKRAMAEPGPLNYDNARIYHWVKMPFNSSTQSGILESIKAPLESRTWYLYRGQYDHIHAGDIAQPAQIGRSVPGGARLDKFQYNQAGKVCERIDWVGRKTHYTWGTASAPDPTQCTSGSGLDLLKIEQLNGSSWDVVQSATYNSQHQAVLVRDAAGQETAYKYLDDGTGRLQTVVSPPRNGHECNPTCNALTLAERTTTYEYFPADDPDSPFRLKRIIGPSVGLTAGPTLELTYDVKGRVRTTTDSDGYKLTMEYDLLDRPTRTSYPDSTYEETTYLLHRLDPDTHRDRLGRVRSTHYDALRRLTEIVGPLPLQKTTMDWCVTCGVLNSITDPEGNTTTWTTDVRGRVIEERRADNAFWTYSYDKAGRVSAVTDAMQQVKTLTYEPDDKLTNIEYANGLTIHDITYVYRPDAYGRLIRMTDPTGTTEYQYHPSLSGGGPAGLGALKLKSVDGPLSNDLIEYTYDEMGRVSNRRLNGSANEVSYRFDSLGRLRVQGTPAGTFVYTYDGPTNRPLSLEYPNGQRAEYAYYPGPGERRLQQIHNKLSAGNVTLSKFSYGYNAVGSIVTRGVQRGTDPTINYTLDYDAADQLRHAVPSPFGPIVPTYEDTYDLAGNRSTHSVDSAVSSATYDVRNGITSYGLPGAGFAVAHDDNGNMTSDGVNQYEWDALDRLVAVTKEGSTLATFSYDGQGRRQQKSAGGVTHTYIYDDSQVIEERLSSGQVIKYIDGLGIDQHLASKEGSTGSLSFFSSDALGSIAEVTSAAGAVTLARSYDFWGGIQAGSNVGGYGFTGRDWDAETGLYFYRARYYNPKMGRFIAEDPLGLSADFNAYRYALDNPVRWTDPLGLLVQVCSREPQNFSSVWGLVVHQVVCVTNKNGRTICGGLVPQNDDDAWVPWPQKGARQVTSPDGMTCTSQPDGPNQACVEKCLRKKIASPNRPQYCPLGGIGLWSWPQTDCMNCQMWVTHTIASCVIKCANAGGK